MFMKLHKYLPIKNLITISYSEYTCSLLLQCNNATGAQGRLPPDMPQYHIGYFELNLLKKQAGQEHSGLPLSPEVRKINLQCESYPPCTRREKDILIIIDKEFRAREDNINISYFC